MKKEECEVVAMLVLLRVPPPGHQVSGPVGALNPNGCIRLMM